MTLRSSEIRQKYTEYLKEQNVGNAEYNTARKLKGKYSDTWENLFSLWRDQVRVTYCALHH